MRSKIQIRIYKFIFEIKSQIRKWKFIFKIGSYFSNTQSNSKSLDENATSDKSSNDRALQGGSVNADDN